MVSFAKAFAIAAASLAAVVGAAPTAQAQCDVEVSLSSLNFGAYYQDAPHALLFRAPAVERLVDAATFFDYRSSSSHTGFEIAGQSMFFLYRDVAADDGTLSLFLIHGADAAPLGPGGQGSASVDITVTGVPAEAFVADSDDGSEFREQANGDFVGDWSFSNNTDGGVISGIPTDVAWEICVDITKFTGDMAQWQYYFGGTDNAPLDPERVVCISHDPDVEPSAVHGEEGVEVTVCGLAAAPSEETLDFSFDWNDPDDPAAVVSGTLTVDEVTCWSHTYADDLTTQVTLTATSTLLACTSSATTTAEIANIAPVVIAPEDAVVPPGLEYIGELVAVDPGDDHPLGAALTAGPDGAVVDGAGLVRWTPTLDDIGEHQLCLDVSDDHVTVSHCWLVEVASACEVNGKLLPGSSCGIVDAGCGEIRCSEAGTWLCQLRADATTSDATCDGIDDDCDGETDEDFEGRDTECGVGACHATGHTLCEAGAIVDACTPGAPGTDDDCDGVDDDCDGAIDEDWVAATTACGQGACASTGVSQCVQGAVVDTCVAGAPAASDADCDGVDDDCNGETDDGGAEVCNGLDDDCDGLVDEGEGVCAALDTEITAHPETFSAEGVADFRYRDPFDPARTRFECSLDGAAWETCDGGALALTGLADGPHALSVRSVGDHGVVDPTPAFYAWLVGPAPGACADVALTGGGGCGGAQPPVGWLALALALALAALLGVRARASGGRP